MSKNRTKSSRNWMQRHLNDPYVKASKIDGYRSRASYKLLELQEKYQLLKPGMRVVDLGAAPGGWSQVVAQKIGAKGHVWALDLLPMAPITNVTFIQGDFNTEEIHAALREALGVGTKLDWVLSDLSPNMTGTMAIDQPRSLELLENVLDFAKQHLKPQGGLLAKAFQGEGFDEFVRDLRKNFKQVAIKKPDSSRVESRELYVLARGYNI